MRVKVVLKLSKTLACLVALRLRRWSDSRKWREIKREREGGRVTGKEKETVQSIIKEIKNY